MQHDTWFDTQFFTVRKSLIMFDVVLQEFSHIYIFHYILPHFYESNDYMIYVQSYFMWDSFTSGVAVSIMRNQHNSSHGENEFAEMEYMNITVVTSNEPFGISDSSNPFFYHREVPRFNLTKGGVHSGHVQTGLRDPLCLGENGKGRCEVIFLGPLHAIFCTS